MAGDVHTNIQELLVSITPIEKLGQRTKEAYKRERWETGYDN